MVPYCTFTYVMTQKDYVMYEMNDDTYCVIDTRHEFKNYWDLMHIMFSASGYFPIMMGTNTYHTTFMFVMMLFYDIVYTTIL